MIIFMDLGLCAVLAVIGFGVIAGTAMTVTEWMLDHVLVVAVLLLIKAVIIIGGEMDIFSKTAGFRERTLCAAAILIDMFRSGIVLRAVLDGVLTAFSGGIFQLLSTGFGLIIGVPILIMASYGPLFIDDKVSIKGEILSLAAVGVCCLILYGVFDGW